MINKNIKLKLEKVKKMSKTKHRRKKEVSIKSGCLNCNQTPNHRIIHLIERQPLVQFTMKYVVMKLNFNPEFTLQFSSMAEN